MIIIDGLLHLIAPRLCAVCGTTLAQGEDTLCLQCYLDLPRTGIHRQPFNQLHQRLGHHTMVDRAAGWFWYKRNSEYAQLLVNAKYGGLPALSRKLGNYCAQELAQDNFFDGIEALVPMPLHWRKRLKRGYNQAEEICRGISQHTGIPIIDVLKAVKGHGVQARNTRQQRFDNIKGTLTVTKPDALHGKAVLFVDDIVTTGATASEAISAINTAQPASISVLCLGLTQLRQ